MSHNQIHYVTEDGVSLDWPFYKVEGTETLIEKRVLAVDESKEYSIESNEPLQIGFRTPFGADAAKQLSFKEPENDFATEVAARLIEIDPNKRFPTSAGSKNGAALFLQPIDGKINFKLVNMMAEPMEFLVYQDELTDKERDLMKPVNVPIGK